jgi:2-dehydropantoate 2-reductase
MKILVVGAGAVGGYFGGRLAQAGRDVTFLVRPHRAQQLMTTGLRITSPHGDLTLTPQLAIAGERPPVCDTVLVAVKAYALHQAMDDFAPAIGNETLIVPLLNGMRHLDLLSARLGKDHILGGVCRVFTAVRSDGSILQLHPLQSVSYGELAGTASPRTQRLDQTLKGAGFDASLSPNILQEMWEKWIYIATVGGITCLLRGTIGEIAAAPGGAELAIQLIGECSATAVAAGFPPDPAFLAHIRSMMTAPGSALASSMYRDLTSGMPVEADHIIGDLLERAKRFSVPVPLLATAFTQLKIYQNRLEVSAA